MENVLKQLIILPNLSGLYVYFIMETWQLVQMMVLLEFLQDLKKEKHHLKSDRFSPISKKLFQKPNFSLILFFFFSFFSLPFAF